MILDDRRRSRWLPLCCSVFGSQSSVQGLLRVARLQAPCSVLPLTAGDECRALIAPLLQELGRKVLRTFCVLASCKALGRLRAIVNAWHCLPLSTAVCLLCHDALHVETS